MNDIIKKSVLEMWEGNSLSMTNVCIIIGVCIIFGAFIYGIYYMAQQKSFFNKQLGIVIAILPTVTAGIILAMQSNLIVSLGMVGALSIVRFRTAIKEPKDMLFLFWSISTGIILGASNFGLALVIAIAVPLLLFLLELLPESRKGLLLVVNLDNEGDEDTLLETVEENVKSSKIKSRNRASDSTDYIIECKTSFEKELLDAVSALDHVTGASLIAHDGEATY